MSETDGSDVFAKMRIAHAIDAARHAIATAEVEGLPPPLAWLRAKLAARIFVPDNAARAIANSLLDAGDALDKANE